MSSDGRGASVESSDSESDEFRYWTTFTRSRGVDHLLEMSSVSLLDLAVLSVVGECRPTRDEIVAWAIRWQSTYACPPVPRVIPLTQLGPHLAIVSVERLLNSGFIEVVNRYNSRKVVGEPEPGVLFHAYLKESAIRGEEWYSLTISGAALYLEVAKRLEWNFSLLLPISRWIYISIDSYLPRQSRGGSTLASCRWASRWWLVHARGYYRLVPAAKANTWWLDPLDVSERLGLEESLILDVQQP